MQTDILLKQIAQRIEQLNASLQEFESARQPESRTAEQLNNDLYRLSSLVGAYAFIMQQQELSPRLDLHLKIAEKVQETEQKQPEIIEPVVPVEPPKTATEQKTMRPGDVVITEYQAPAERPVEPVKTSYPPLNVGLNDKFRIINELFRANAVEYGIAVEQINAIGSWSETQIYLNGLKNIYGWDEEQEMVKKLFSISQKRFS